MLTRTRDASGAGPAEDESLARALPSREALATEARCLMRNKSDRTRPDGAVNGFTRHRVALGIVAITPDCTVARKPSADRGMSSIVIYAESTWLNGDR